MNEPQAMMTCDWCGKNFPANASACVESGITCDVEFQEGEEWKSKPFRLEDISEKDWRRLQNYFQITEDQVRELIETGKLSGMGAIVCLECQQDNSFNTLI